MEIRTKDLLYLMLLIPFFPPGFISYQFDDLSVILNQVLNIWLYISAITVGFLYLKKPGKYYYKFIIAVALYTSLLVVSTCLNAGNVMVSINAWGKRVAVCMLAAMITYEKRFDVVCRYYKVLILINLLLTFIMPDGFGSIEDGNIISFMGHKNQQIQYMVLFLTLQFLQNGTDQRIKDRIWILICLLNEFLCQSSTGITLLALYAILLSFPFSKIKKFISNHSMAISMLTTVFSIILTLSFQLIVNIPVVKWYILNVLHKRLDLTARPVLWAETWLRVSMKPLFGVGNILDLSEIQGVSTGTWAARIIRTDHNAVLSIIYKTGFVGLAGFIVLCGIASYSKDKSLKIRKEYMWISLGILIFLLDGFMEGAIEGGYYLYWMMLMQYASNHKAFSEKCLIA